MAAVSGSFTTLVTFLRTCGRCGAGRTTCWCTSLLSQSLYHLSVAISAWKKSSFLRKSARRRRAMVAGKCSKVARSQAGYGESYLRGDQQGVRWNT